MKPFLFLAVWLVCAPNEGTGQELIVSTFDDKLYGSSIYKWDNDKKREFFRDERVVFWDHGLKPSPDGKYVGAISSSKEYRTNEEGHQYVAHDLLILTTDGTILDRIAEVQRYCWSPGGDQIAAIIGIDIEGFGFKTTKTVIYDIKTKETRTLLSGNEQDIQWAEFDSMIYVTNYAMFSRINPNTGSRSIVNYKGIYFSPAGRYYFNANYEGGSFAVYERTTNRDVTPKELRDGRIFVNSHQWLPSGAILVAGDVTKEQKVVDMHQKKVLHTFSGRLMGFDSAQRELILMKHPGPGGNAAKTSIERVRIQ